jgi:hypothetical protein
MHAVLRGQAAGGYLELLQRIRKRERHVQVVVVVVVHRAVERVRHARAHAAGNRDGYRVIAVP